MWYRTVLLIFCLIVTAYLRRVKRESNQCLAFDYNTKLCRSIDKEINPCEDFYKFACGQYIELKKRLNFVNGSLRIDYERRSKEDYMDYLNSFLNYTNFTNLILEEVLVIDLYKSCMNREKFGLQPMLQLLEEYGGWPVLRNRNYNPANWVGLNITMLLLKSGFDMAPIFKMKYKPGPEKMDGELFIERPDFAVDRHRLLNDSLNYETLMIDVAMQFGANQFVAWFDMHLVSMFELSLVKIYDQPNNMTLNTIKEMALLYPEVMKLIRPFLETFGKIKIRLHPVQYFEVLETTLNAMSEKYKDRTIANYIIWRTVVAAARYLTPDLFRRITTGLNKINGLRNNTNDSLLQINKEACFDHVHKLLPVALDYMYNNIDEVLLDQKREVSYLISRNIRKEFIDLVQEADWMDDETKNKTIRKLQFVFVRNALSGYKMSNIASIKLKSDNFPQNFVRIIKWQRVYDFRNFRVPAWAVNAFYSRLKNEIHIPAGLLHSPMFFVDAPSYFNYGSLGYTMAHEFGHVLDYRNYLYNEFGLPSNWSKNANSRYRSKSNCFKELYSEMQTETGIKLKGQNTIREDVADNLGARIAYRAFRNVTKGSQQSYGIWNYTDRQLFWVSLAQVHCGFTDPSTYQRYVDVSRYSLRPYRVFGMIINVPEFSYDDFRCRINTRMSSHNFPDQCILW